MAGRHGAELIASGQAPRVLAGSGSPHQMIVIVRFPSMQALDTWHGSQAYQDIIPLREDASDQEITVYQIPV